MTTYNRRRNCNDIINSVFLLYFLAYQPKTNNQTRGISKSLQVPCKVYSHSYDKSCGYYKGRPVQRDYYKSNTDDE